MDYLKEQADRLKQLDKAGFNEEQVSAIMDYTDFRIDSIHEYRDSKLDELKIFFTIQLRKHEHLETGKAVTPI